MDESVSGTWHLIITIILFVSSQTTQLLLCLQVAQNLVGRARVLLPLRLKREQNLPKFTQEANG